MRRDPDTGDPNFWVFARDYLHAYMPRARRLSPRTVQAYRISLECLIGYLSDVEGVDREYVSFDHLERPHLKAWLTWMSEQKGYTPNTIALRLSAIKAFLAYSAAEDITLVALHQGAQALRAPASPKKPIEYLTGDQTRAVLGAFTGASTKSRRNRMLLILLYEAAARVSEITDLALADLSLDKPGHLRLTGKRNKTRTVPLTDVTMAHLGVYLAEFHPDHASLPASRPVFYSNHLGQPSALSVDTVAAVLQRAASTARATCPTVPANIHCHMLRKTKAMDLYQQGIPLPIIMRLLGHESASTTSTFYAFATLDMMRQAVDAATPAISTPPAQPLNQDQLNALYDLR